MIVLLLCKTDSSTNHDRNNLWVSTMHASSLQLHSNYLLQLLDKRGLFWALSDTPLTLYLAGCYSWSLKTGSSLSGRLPQQHPGEQDSACDVFPLQGRRRRFMKNWKWESSRGEARGSSQNWTGISCRNRSRLEFQLRIKPGSFFSGNRFCLPTT